MWNKNQLEAHLKAAELLGIVKDEILVFLKENHNISEKETLAFVKKRYKANGLVNDSKKEFAIVAFGKNTKEVHYFPSSSSNLKLRTNNLILIDIWARLDKPNSPYADMTWMAFRGKKIPNEIQKTWQVLVKARDAGINFLQKINSGSLPRGLDIDRICHDVIGNTGLGVGIKHTIGHSLGFDHPHGKLSGINWREYSPILKNVGYTIEPGIYLKNFGMRTEIDFYISENNELIVTTPIQKNIDIL